jgi:putative NADH-flavin reductase
MKNIAIVGSTGMIGQPVTNEFIKAGYNVSVLVRNPGKAKRIFGSKVNYVKGDLQDINSIKAFLHEQDFLYLNLSVESTSNEKDFQAEREGLKNILKATKTSKVKRVGYLSSLVHFYQGQNGFTWWVFGLKQNAVSLIKSSELTYSIFYPSTFMEGFVKGGYKQGNNIALAGTSKYKMFLISGSDYGQQIIKAFELNNGNQEYVIQGQDGFTADEAAKIVIENSKTIVKVMKAPLNVLKFFGLFSKKFNYASKIMEALNDYPEKFEAEKTWQDLGQPPTKFIDYIKNC